jgi:hypothetical protein
MPAAPPSLKGAYLLENAAETNESGMVDMKVMSGAQSFQTIAFQLSIANIEVTDTDLEILIEGSMDGEHWFTPGVVITGSGIRTEGQHVFQFVRATIISLDPGISVTVMVSWAL